MSYRDLEKRQAYKRRWTKMARKRPGKTRENYLKWAAIMKERNAAKRREILAAAMASKPTCATHPNVEPAYSKNAWHCPQCRRDEENKLARSKTLDRIAKKYGSEVASIYGDCQGFVNKSEGFTFKVALFKSLQDHIESVCGYRPTRTHVKRLTELNAIIGKPIANHAWSCLFCGLESSNPFFFDVDHIVERSKGGSEDRTNKRILCPNCHRKRHTERFMNLRQTA